ncbi:MAG: lysostaphin resistance A-like protein, partial [Planctomycetaceae bacterium]
ARGALAEKLQAVAVVLLVPITEEIMFRGAMYRHLREASGRGGVVVSVLFSLFFSSFLFAVIHPQGPAGVPLLMSIAIVLAVVREWRESLVSPIVTHMVVNGVTTSLALLAFS